MARITYTGDELAAALWSALEDPDEFVVPVESAPAPGVVAFGRVVDGLIGVVTPVAGGPGTPGPADAGDLAVSGGNEEGRR